MTAVVRPDGGHDAQGEKEGGGQLHAIRPGARPERVVTQREEGFAHDELPAQAGGQALASAACALAGRE